jgi:hypothetical protein
MVPLGGFGKYLKPKLERNPQRNPVRKIRLWITKQAFFNWLFSLGAGERNRTSDLLITNPGKSTRHDKQQ